MNRFRLGVLSFAHYHANFWAEEFLADPRVILAGIQDDDAARGLDAATRFRTAYHSSTDELLDGVDAVAITSETARHRELIEAAADAGCAILCEKPLATSLTDLVAIEKRLARAGVPFMQSFPKRLDPANIALRRIIATGALGRIWLARVRHGHAHGLEEAFTSGWWTNPSLSGGGTLIDEGIHAADFLRWLFGDPVEVRAIMSHGSGLAVEDAAIATFRWRDGLLAEIVAGWSFHAADASVEIYGTEGTAILSGVDLASKNAPRSGFLRISTRTTNGFVDQAVTPGFVAGGFHRQSARAFIDALENAVPPAIGIEAAGGALRMILSAYESAKSGASIALVDEKAEKV